jgi:hypothetical protein
LNVIIGASERILIDATIKTLSSSCMKYRSPLAPQCRYAAKAPSEKRRLRLSFVLETFATMYYSVGRFEENDYRITDI